MVNAVGIGMNASAAILKFLNRLSDALFVLARWIGKAQGEQELLWQRDCTAP